MAKTIYTDWKAAGWYWINASRATLNPPNTPGGLTDAGAAPLDQEAQHEYGQHTGDDPGKHNTVHIESPFSQINQ